MRWGSRGEMTTAKWLVVVALLVSTWGTLRYASYHHRRHVIEQNREGLPNASKP